MSQVDLVHRIDTHGMKEQRCSFVNDPDEGAEHPEEEMQGNCNSKDDFLGATDGKPLGRQLAENDVQKRDQ